MMVRICRSLALLAMVALTACSTLPRANPGGFEVTEASIPQLQDALESGALTSELLVEAYLARIEAYDEAGPQLNAILTLNPAALEQARALDAERRRSGPRSALHGIPVVVKDNYDVAGLPTSGGSIALRNHQPGADAFQVARLKDAGAIILGKTNLHELAYGITTISSAGGQTLNPYDPTRNPGGSSGGTGAAVAASLAAIGWGSDTCGSIRIPSAHNALVGLRPTKGLSSIDGVLPLSATQDVGGPLARSIRDLAIALDATVGPDANDPATVGMPTPPDPGFVTSLGTVDVRDLRIGVLEPLFGDAPEDREVADIVRAALDEMGAAGATVISVPFPELADLLSGTSTITAEFKWDLARYLARTPNPPVHSLAEILERGEYHPEVEARLRASDRATEPDPTEWATILNRRGAALERVEALMRRGRLDALAYPVIRRVAAPVGDPAPGSNCQLSATTGMPALAIPAGWSEEGLPVGVELLGPRWSDTRLVAAGYALEQRFPRRRPPPTTPPLP